MIFYDGHYVYDNYDSLRDHDDYDIYDSLDDYDVHDVFLNKDLQYNYRVNQCTPLYNY